MLLNNENMQHIPNSKHISTTKTAICLQEPNLSDPLTYSPSLSSLAEISGMQGVYEAEQQEMTLPLLSPVCVCVRVCVCTRACVFERDSL